MAKTDYMTIGQLRNLIERLADTIPVDYGGPVTIRVGDEELPLARMLGLHESQEGKLLEITLEAAAEEDDLEAIEDFLSNDIVAARMKAERPPSADEFIFAGQVPGESRVDYLLRQLKELPPEEAAQFNDRLEHEMIESAEVEDDGLGEPDYLSVDRCHDSLCGLGEKNGRVYVHINNRTIPARDINLDHGEGSAHIIVRDEDAAEMYDEEKETRCPYCGHDTEPVMDYLIGASENDVHKLFAKLDDANDLPIPDELQEVVNIITFNQRTIAHGIAKLLKKNRADKQH